jgi:UDP-N-acetylmuramoyl-tripeptide--D-alanyl-D-alanine ligase
MEERTLEFVTEGCGGELLNGCSLTVVSRVCTDSRQVQPGDLFFALAGERFDAHQFIPEVACQGAAGVVVERAKIPEPLPACAVIAVENVRRALGGLAARYRADFTLPMIAVAGSNGKTTTKELLTSVLGQRFKTLSSAASFNNDIGVPLTLLRLDRSHEVAVLEAGTNHPGELAPLLDWIRPGIGVLTNIGREHLEHFGGLEGVVEEESALAESLPAGGMLFLNGDDGWSGAIRSRTQARVITAGLSPRSHCRAGQVCMDENGVSFEVVAHRPELSGGYRIRLLGRHQVVNALLALAAGGELGLTAEEIRRGLADCVPAKMRLQTSTVCGVRILDDSYNANADSMIAALETLRDLPCAGRRVAVLGDMAELGVHSLRAHAEVGEAAARTGVDWLLSIGRMAGEIASAAERSGLKRVVRLRGPDLAAEVMAELVQRGDLVLVKASRSSRLERVVEQLRELLSKRVESNAQT